MSYAGVPRSQEYIFQRIYLYWWGVTNDTTLAFLSQYFSDIGYKTNSNVDDVKKLLKEGYVIIADWMDGIGATPDDPADGHYSIIVGYEEKSRNFILADPTLEDRRIWKIHEEDFNDVWYDYVDAKSKIKINKWMLWLNPNKIDYKPAYAGCE